MVEDGLKESVVRGTILAIITISVYGHHISMMTHASDPSHQSPHFHPDADIYAWGHSRGWSQGVPSLQCHYATIESALSNII